MYRRIMPLPNAFIIGVQKAGTTSLHNWLAQHPDIYAPLELKDKDYFANPEVAIRAKERLLKDFSGHEGESVILQSQVNYLFYPEALERIKALTPEAKLVVVLRNPVDRAISAYRYFKKIGNENRKAEQALLYKPKATIPYSHHNNDFTYLEHGMYGQQLESVYKEFPPQSVLVLRFAELTNNPVKLVSKVFGFLGVDKKNIPTFKHKNKTGTVYIKWLQERLTSTSWLRQKIIKYLFNWWLPGEKRQLLRKQLIEFNTGEKKEKDNLNGLRERLQPLFKDDQKKLKKIMKNY